MELQQARPVPVRRPPSPPTPALPLRVRGTILRRLPSPLFLLFGYPQPPVATFHDASTTEGCVELTRCDSQARAPAFFQSCQSSQVQEKVQVRL